MKFRILGKDYYTTREEIDKFFSDNSVGVYAVANDMVFIRIVPEVQVFVTGKADCPLKVLFVYRSNEDTISFKSEEEFLGKLPDIESFIVEEYDYLKSQLKEYSEFEEEIQKYKQLKEVI